MKRIISLILALALACTMFFMLVACNEPSGNNPNEGGSGNGGSGGDGGDSVTKPSEDYNPLDPEQYIYKNVFANSPHKAKWETGYSGADLYGIWDQSVLPAGFPSKPDSVTKIDRTSYVGVLDGKLHTGGRQLGLLWVDDTDYQEYYVMFTGTEETFNDVTSQLKQNFKCFDDRDDSWGSDERISGYFYAFSNDLYFYMSYSQDREWSDEANNFVLTGEWSFTLYAMPVYHKLPKIFQGINLPTFGYATSGVGTIQSYSDGDDDVAWLDYDYQTGKVTGTLGDYWASEELHYYGVSEEQAISYGATLIAAGFEKTQDGDNEYGQLYWSYKKDDVLVVIDLYTENTQMVINIEMGGVWYH